MNLLNELASQVWMMNEPIKDWANGNEWLKERNAGSGITQPA